MSGIVGIINLDGAPLDRDLLRRMTRFMTYRGPDAQELWIEGRVGFGHTMLRTTFESVHEKQPCSLDGKVWITADARVDGRADLFRSLRAKGQEIFITASDVELILRAYQAWEEDCVEHLIGDFSFAIWDGRERRLFCARDHFGVKLFYHALVGNTFIFSNTLNCVRLHPAISDDLNDLAIGDFLLFGYNREPSSTSFADIQRLAPAHCLSLSTEIIRPKWYWDFPVDRQLIRYKAPREYIEQFRHVLYRSVDDRIRTGRLGVWMSGGLDSTMITAAACELREKTSSPLKLQAYCGVYGKLIRDDERYYSGLVADDLRIPIEYLALDDYELFERWDEIKLSHPEPVQEPLLAQWIDFVERISANSRVAFYGEDGDALLATGTVAATMSGISVAKALTAFAKYLLSYRRIPPLGLGIYTKLKSWRNAETPSDLYPKWLNPQFERRYDLKKRWIELTNLKPAPLHPTHPQTHCRLTGPIWQSFFESLDPGVTGFPLEIRLPILDLRLVNYILSIPPVPWCVDKHLARRAMSGKLPEAIRQRPKTPLAPKLYDQFLGRSDSQSIDLFEPCEQLTQYVDRSAVPRVFAEIPNLEQAWAALRPFSLDLWLKDLHSNRLWPISNSPSAGAKERELLYAEL